MRLAADANVLLAAVLGGRARLVLASPDIDEVLTTEPTIAEVRKYAALLAEKRRLPADLLFLAGACLPVTVVVPKDYAASMAEAKRRIGRRDPDDVPLLALAIQFGVPVWSNDKDFEGCGVPWLTTEAVLRQLGMLSSR